jgi:hypothetical protein
MTTLIYSILIALKFVISPAEFDQLPVAEQQEMLIIITDTTLHRYTNGLIVLRGGF